MNLVNRRYELVHSLGRGADADVMLALDRDREDAWRALKLVRGIDDAFARDRLAGEFRRLAALAHPRLVRVYDLEVVASEGPLPRGTLFFTADYVEGQPAPAALASLPEPLRAEALLDLAEDVAQALAHVHAAGLVHHDVKPTNILVTAQGRATLLDLGLSTARAATGQARGTVTYMSPEALAAVEDQRLDLYALGATLYEAACGSPPFAGATQADLVRAILWAPLMPLRPRAPWLPEALEALILKLLRRAPQERHSSAAVVCDDLARIRHIRGKSVLELHGPPAEDPDRISCLLPPPLIGREEPLEKLDAVLKAFAAGEAAPPGVLLVGGPGAGKSRLIQEAVRQHQLRVAALRSERLDVLGDAWPRLTSILGLGALDRELDRELDDAPAFALRCAQDAALALGRRSTQARVLVHLADAETDERSAALLRLRVTEDQAPWLLVAEVCRAEHDEALAIDLLPLQAAQVEEVASGMLGTSIAPAWARALFRGTSGVPRLVVEAVRAAALQAGTSRADSVPVEEVLGTRGLLDLVERRLERLAPRTRALLEALAVWGEATTIEPLLAVAGQSELEPAAAYAELAELAVLGAQGLVEITRDVVAFPATAYLRAVYDAIPGARRRDLHDNALRHAETHGASPLVRARHLAVVGEGREAARVCLAAAAAARAHGDLQAAFGHLGDAARMGDGVLAHDALFQQGEMALVLGRYEEALVAARRATLSRDSWRRRRAERLCARILARRGDLDSAAELLERLVTSDPTDEEARGALARLLVTRGRHHAALDLVGTLDLGEKPAWRPGLAMLLEALGLAALYSGNLAAAGAAFDKLEGAAREASEQGTLSRAHSLQGLLAHFRGDMVEAAHKYGEALVCAQAAGDIHAAALCGVNRAVVFAERGLWGEVLSSTAALLRDLRRVGQVKELPGVLLNRGIAFLAVGDLGSARATAEKARSEARARGLPQIEAYAEMLAGDVSRRGGDSEQALTVYRRAGEIASQSGSVREVALAAMSRAEVLAELGRPRAANAALTEAEASCAGEDERERLVLSAGRVTLVQDVARPSLLRDLLETCRRLRETGRLDLAWRAEAVSAQLAYRAGDWATSQGLLERASETFASLVANAPEIHRDGLSADPDARRLEALKAHVESTADRPALSPGPATVIDAETGRLRRLLGLSKRLNSELRLQPLLDEIIDTVIEVTGAERGFLMLRDAEGRLLLRVARNIDQRALEGEDLAWSRSIAERAATTGEVVLTVDAATDARFDGAASVSALSLRSVLAAPLRLKGTVVGTLYVDDRFRCAAFTEEAARYVLDLADIAAVALENARLAEDNERQRAEVAALAQRLEVELAENRAELDGARAALRATAALELRYPYDALIGRSPRMVELLRIVDRATESALPVVIYGESGTGKELIARALHLNGPRKRMPLLPVNCGALPETLLEAELFGHVRGAFTGADRDRRGLFEIADGGTLFLDEIADTSAAMQTRLLRVLQEGEVRRVGSERARTVDVRIICASNRDLRQLVDEGRFREDLFYRLHVIRLDVPPLRERTEDIPALVDHFLKKLAGGGKRATKVARVDRSALTRLIAYPWPGNVRELENELSRATALGGDVIGVKDLSAAVATTEPGARPTSAGDLTVKPRVEQLERTLIREALTRTGRNQSRAAKLLGLSRFGLQKKLRRYGL